MHIKQKYTQRNTEQAMLITWYKISGTGVYFKQRIIKNSLSIKNTSTTNYTALSDTSVFTLSIESYILNKSA